MLETLIVSLIVWWLLGFIGPSLNARIPRAGNTILVLLAIILIPVIARLL